MRQKFASIFKIVVWCRKIGRHRITMTTIIALPRYFILVPVKGVLSVAFSTLQSLLSGGCDVRLPLARTAVSASQLSAESLSQCCALPRASCLRTGVKWSRVVPALFFWRFVTFWRRFAIHYFNTTYIKLMFALCWLCCIVLGVSLLCSFSKCIQQWHVGLWYVKLYNQLS